jgi:hypothetical protein
MAGGRQAVADVYKQTEKKDANKSDENVLSS